MFTSVAGADSSDWQLLGNCYAYHRDLSELLYIH